MASSQILTNLLIILVLFIAVSFFVAAEFALVQTRPSALEDAIKNKKGNIKKLKDSLHMLKNLNEYLSTTQVGITLASLLLGWIGEATAEEIFINIFKLIPRIPATTSHIIGVALGMIILTYFEVVFTEIVPKNIAIDLPVKTMMVIVKPLKFVHFIFYPFVEILNKSSNFIVRLLGFPPAEEGNEILTQTEILSLSKTAVTGGDMDKNDIMFMQRAFELNDKTARDIMVDRTSLYVVDNTATVKDVIQDYLKEGYSRFPVVADNDKDQILGYVYIYDLIRQAQVDDSTKISKLIRSIHSVPEGTPIHSILKTMIHKRTPMVAVVDEYGGTSGIITDKDIYEELFGSVKDEIDDVSDEYITKIPKSGNMEEHYEVSGKTTLYDFERYFHKKIPEFDESEIITIAGYILENYNDLHEGSVINIDNFEFKIVEYIHSFPNLFEVTEHSEAVQPPQKDTNDESTTD